MLLAWREAAHIHFIDLCILFALCFSFTFYILSLALLPSSKNKVRVYWLNVRRVKITGQRLKAGTVDWACRGGGVQLSPTHWDFEAGSVLLPSLGSALTCLTLPTVTCQDQHSSSGETEERRGPAEYFDTTPPSSFQRTQQRSDQNKNSSTFKNWCNKQTGGERYGQKGSWNDDTLRLLHI